MPSSPVRLGVNLDHVATLRNARGEGHPSLHDALKLVLNAGADGITMHLREDRRHILDADLEMAADLLSTGPVPLNMEMAATDEMVAIASRLRVAWVCLVPERREERTTEQGLNLAANATDSTFDSTFASACETLLTAGIKVSLFIDAEESALITAARLGVDAVEIHTGHWCRAFAKGEGTTQEVEEWRKIVRAEELCSELKLGFHAGHGLNYDTAQRIAALPQLAEVNIGHFLIGEAISYGLGEAVRRMRNALNDGRKNGSRNGKQI
ncbi:MAG: pyridoxine 5'-phosphate synthase [Alphaproteobacteria bacterium]